MKAGKISSWHENHSHQNSSIFPGGGGGKTKKLCKIFNGNK